MSFASINPEDGFFISLIHDAINNITEGQTVVFEHWKQLKSNILYTSSRSIDDSSSLSTQMNSSYFLKPQYKKFISKFFQKRLSDFSHYEAGKILRDLTKKVNEIHTTHLAQKTYNPKIKEALQLLHYLSTRLEHIGSTAQQEFSKIAQYGFSTKEDLFILVNTRLGGLNLDEIYNNQISIQESIAKLKESVKDDEPFVSKLVSLEQQLSQKAIDSEVMEQWKHSFLANSNDEIKELWACIEERVPSINQVHNTFDELIHEFTQFVNTLLGRLEEAKQVRQKIMMINPSKIRKLQNVLKRICCESDSETMGKVDELMTELKRLDSLTSHSDMDELQELITILISLSSPLMRDNHKLNAQLEQLQSSVEKKEPVSLSMLIEIKKALAKNRCINAPVDNSILTMILPILFVRSDFIKMKEYADYDILVEVKSKITGKVADEDGEVTVNELSKINSMLFNGRLNLMILLIERLEELKLLSRI